MADKNKRIDTATNTETVGHEWDGIEELNTPLPRWWLWSFYLCIIFSIGYCILYPAWPMIDRATAGTLGWSSRADLAEELSTRQKALEPVRQALVAGDINQLAANESLFNQAVQGGASAFKVHCVQCHGSGAAGSKGYPNLNDDDWLWGGSLEQIEYTLINGIRQPGHAATRTSMMPAFGRDGILTANQIQDVVSYVRTLSGDEKPSAASRRGAEQFAVNCIACHGAEGKGGREFGAPNLSDAIALYGKDRATLTESLYGSRQGVMPAWGERLDAPTIRMLAAYVWSLGGGEAAAPKAQQASAPAPTASEAGANEQQ